MTQAYHRTQGILNIDLLKPQTLVIAGLGSAGSLFASCFAYPFNRYVLVDPENLEPENLERHLLDQSWLGRPKVEGVKNWLVGKGLNPDQIFAHQGYAEDILADLDRIDLLVIGIDKHSVKSQLADFAWERSIPVIYLGIFPQGSGGRVIVTPDPAGPCYHCAWNLVGGHDYQGKTNINYGIDPTTIAPDDTGDLHAVPALAASIAPVAARAAQFAKSILTGDSVTPQVWNIVYDNWEVVFHLSDRDSLAQISHYLAFQHQQHLTPQFRLHRLPDGSFDLLLRDAIMSHVLTVWDLCPLHGLSVGLDEI